jgi:predicted ATP-dependent serine protease
VINTENKYYCQNCGEQIKSTDTMCPKCGKNLKEVGRRIEVTVTASIGLSSSFEVELTKKQKSIVKKVYQAIKNELAKKEIESITFGFPQLVSVKIKNKQEKTEDKQKT